jgi:hypothetical protein
MLEDLVGADPRRILGVIERALKQRVAYIESEQAQGRDPWGCPNTVDGERGDLTLMLGVLPMYREFIESGMAEEIIKAVQAVVEAQEKEPHE